jgi:NADH-quinone oxidoreductase subunit C
MRLEVNKGTEILKNIRLHFNVQGKIQHNHKIWLSIDKKKLITICIWLKDQGFEHLSAISVTDWIKEGIFEITYHLWSYTDNILLTVKTTIDRKNPIIASVSSIWKQSAQIHERELHELFGVQFEGNPNLSSLFLDDWQGPPPFRKEFDSRRYVRETYYSKENEREIVYYE